MHSIPYRTKMRLKAGLKTTLIILAVLLVLDALAIIYLGRYVVYGEDGVRIDFDRSTGKTVDPSELMRTEEASVPEVELIYGDPKTNETGAELFSGYYIDTAMLQNPDEVLSALQALDGPCTVMIDLKSRSGSFYYSTGIEGAVTADSIDVSQVDEIVSYLRANGFTTIARVKSFCDTNFALEHISSGIPTSETALWRDRNGYFWIDPEDELVIEYLKQIVAELSGKGFREIVLDEFYYPESSQILYTSEKTKTELVNDAAQQLVRYFLNTNITISFGDPHPGFSVQSESARIYLSGVDGSGVSDALATYGGGEDGASRLVFLTGSRDTRFEGCSLLRPLL